MKLLYIGARLVNQQKFHMATHTKNLRCMISINLPCTRWGITHPSGWKLVIILKKQRRVGSFSQNLHIGRYHLNNSFSLESATKRFTCVKCVWVLNTPSGLTRRWKGIFDYFSCNWHRQIIFAGNNWTKTCHG